MKTSKVTEMFFFSSVEVKAQPYAKQIIQFVINLESFVATVFLPKPMRSIKMQFEQIILINSELSIDISISFFY